MLQDRPLPKALGKSVQSMGEDDVRDVHAMKEGEAFENFVLGGGDAFFASASTFYRMHVRESQDRHISRRCLAPRWSHVSHANSFQGSPRAESCRDTALPRLRHHRFGDRRHPHSALRVLSLSGMPRTIAETHPANGFRLWSCCLRE